MSDEQGETDTEDGASEGPDGHAGGDADGVDPASLNRPAAGSGTEPDVDASDDGDAAGNDDGATVDEVAERVADSDPAAIAAEIVGLREDVWGLERERDDLQAERDDLEDRLKRKAAEFQNYKKRQEDRRAEIRDRATEALVEELLEVRDNLDRALAQDENADIRSGVEATFRQLEEILASENVEAIEPAPGSEVDPARHEVLLNVPSERPDGTVAELHRSGYEMAGKVLRPAQVTVADGDPE